MFRCGIGTLGRTRSRAGSVDESLSRTLCRSVTPIRCSSAAQFDDKFASTLPKNFGTNHGMLSERINQKNETRKNEGRNDDLVSDEKGTSAISGKNSEIVNFYLYFCLNTKYIIFYETFFRYSTT